jgi:hypothetical protein
MLWGRKSFCPFYINVKANCSNKYLISSVLNIKIRFRNRLLSHDIKKFALVLSITVCPPNTMPFHCVPLVFLTVLAARWQVCK